MLQVVDFNVVVVHRLKLRDMAAVDAREELVGLSLRDGLELVSVKRDY